MAESTEEDLFKFPRTRHLFDAGGNGVSRDDLLMDPNEEATFYSSRHHRVLIAVEEKVDGANLGISIGHDMKVYVQNRSHYINSKSHRQFSTLDAWLSDHSPSLYEVLEPGKHVLFGEWLYAKHSIHYTSLPGCFMAFDIYDRSCDKFYSWRERNRILETTSIPVVRTIGEVTINGRQEVVQIYLCD
jgi:atypical dual specificity phosphatase